MAWAFVAHTDGAFDEELLLHFLAAYQETRELNLGEMWALPTTMRVVLVENLRRLAERVATHKAAREVANLCSDRIEAFSLHALEQLLALLERRGVGSVFLAQMAQRLGSRQSGNLRRVHEWLQRALPDVAAVQAQQVADQAADNLSVSNAVNSLRSIGDADWSDIIARGSLLMQRMLGTPLFAAEHAQTRDQTLHRIERLARRSGRSERVVAQTLLELMHGADAEPARAPRFPAIGCAARAAPRWCARWACMNAARCCGVRPCAGSCCPPTWARCWRARSAWWPGCCGATPPARRPTRCMDMGRRRADVVPGLGGGGRADQPPHQRIDAAAAPAAAGAGAGHSSRSTG